MKETWTFNIDLTYEHKIERYESNISTGPFLQSSDSRPTASVQSGVWAPPDWIRDQWDLFLMSSNGFARQMKLEWLDNSNCDYRACSIDGQRFGPRVTVVGDDAMPPRMETDARRGTILAR